MAEHLIASLVVGLMLTSWIWIGWIPRRWTFAATVTWAIVVEQAGRRARRLARQLVDPLGTGIAVGLIATVPLLAAAVLILCAITWIENW